MGLTPSGMQPFEMDGSYVVCNGELYGFETQKQQLMQKDTHSRATATVKLYFLYTANTA